MTDHPCPSPVQLAAFLIGESSDDRDVAEHVETCSSCQSAIDTLYAADSLTVALGQVEGAVVEVSPHCEQALEKLEQQSERFSRTIVDHLSGSDDLIVLPPTLGSYEVVGKIASGGMGAVYKVRHVRLNRIFALKVLRMGRSENSAAIERFEREWQAAGSVVHPHVVQATDANEQEGTRFLVMEYVDGRDFSELVKRGGAAAVPAVPDQPPGTAHRAAARGLSLADASELIRQSALGLHAAHAAGLVHRDVKPSNLMLNREGQVKLLDLGVALLTGTDPDGSELTTHGQILGTIEYISPEQVDHSHQVDHRADIYSLGCTLYYLLTGAPPFASRKSTSVRQILNAHASEPAPPLSGHRDDVPAEFEELLSRLMAKDPAARPADMQQVAELLTPWAEGHDVPGLAAMHSQAAMDKRQPVRPGAKVIAGSTDVPAESHRLQTDEATDPPSSPGHHAAGQYDRDPPTDSPDQVPPGKTAIAEADASRTDVGDLTTVSPADPPSRRRPLSALAGALILTLLAGVVIIIRTKDGEQKVTVEDGSQIVIDVTGGADSPPAAPSRRPDPVADATRLAVWQPSPEQQAFFDEVAKLPAEQQVEAVREKLMEVNPEFDGNVGHDIAGSQIVHLTVTHDDHLSDLWPIRALDDLESLTCTFCASLSDLTPLAGIGLTELRCWQTQVSDLSPLKGMRLTHLNVADTLVKDLSPLQGMPLTYLNLNRTGVADLSPLAGMPLAALVCNSTRVADLTPLEGAPLTSLDCSLTRVSDLSPLEGMPLMSLTVNDTSVSDLSPLVGMPLSFLKLDGAHVSDLSPLAGMPLRELQCTRNRVSDLSPLEGMPLTRLSCGQTRVTDLSPLKGMPLTYLNCHGTRITSLSGLEGMPLTSLDCNGTRVSDLSPLEGMPLQTLRCEVKKVSDLSPLAGMPLQELWCRDTNVIDLSPLAGMGLKVFYADRTPLTDLSPLEGMPLEIVSIRGTSVSDLSPLSGAPLQFLQFSLSKIKDLSPLQGAASLQALYAWHLDGDADLSVLEHLPVKRLHYGFRLFHPPDEKSVRAFPLNEIGVSNNTSLFSPIKEFWTQVETRRNETAAFVDELKELSPAAQIQRVRERLVELNGTNGFDGSFGSRVEQGDIAVTLPAEKIADITPLRALSSLKRLTLTGDHDNFYDLSPLNSLPLEELNCEEHLVRWNRDVLREMTALRRINGRPASEVLESDPVPTTAAPGVAGAPARGTLAERLREQFGPAPLPEPGEPISPAALVTEPAALDGLRAWTLETPQHRGRINVCRFSPDGTRLATGGADATIRLWNVADRTLAGILLGHDCPVQSLEWSRDGSALLTAGGNEICLWDARMAQLLRRLITEDSPAARVGAIRAVWGSDETDVISFSGDGNIRFWDLKSGTTYRVINDVKFWKDVPQPLASERRSARMATCSQREPVRLWDMRTGELLQTWEHEAELLSVAISPDGRMVAAAGIARQTRFVHIWDADTGETLFAESPIEYPSSGYSVDSLAFSPDGKRLAGPTRDGRVHTWNMQTGQPLPAMATPHASVTALCWSDDGKRLATAGMGNGIALAFFDGATGRPQGTVSGDDRLQTLTGLDWHPSEPRLAVGFRDPSNGGRHGPMHGAAVWNLRGETATEDAFIPNSPGTRPNWSPDGRWLVDTYLNVYHVQERVSRRPSAQGHNPHNRQEQRAFSSDNSHFAVALRRTSDQREVVQLRSPPDWNVVRELGDYPEISGLDFSPDGTRIAIQARTEEGFLLAVHDVATGDLVASTKPPRGGGTVRWSADGLRIAASDEYGVAVLHAEALKFESWLPCGGPAGEPVHPLWLGGDHIAGADTNRILIWNLQAPAESGRVVHRLNERPRGGIVISSAPDGRHLAAAALHPSTEPRVAIWDWQAERVVATLIVPPGEPAFPVAVSAEGHFRWLGEKDDPAAALIAIIQTDDGQSWLPLEEFTHRFGWTNDPGRVRTFGPGE